MRPWKYIRQYPTEAFLVTIVFWVYGYFYSGQNWNQNSRFDVIYSFVESGTKDTLTFRIDRFIKDPRQGHNTGDYAIHDGHYYSNKAPGITFLGIPLYAVLYYGERWVGIDATSITAIRWNAYLLNLALSVFWVAIAAVVLYRFFYYHLAWSENESLFVTLTFCFATVLFPFSTSFFGHAATAGFVTIAFTNVFIKHSSPALIGAFLGMASLSEYSAIIYLPLGLFALWSQQKGVSVLWRCVLGMVPFIAVLMIYQKLCFGGFLTTAAEASNPRLLIPGQPFGELGAPSPTVLIAELFSWSRGMFVYSPVLLFLFIGTPQAVPVIRKVSLLGVFMALLLISCHKAGWHGGLCTGPRYLVFSLPFWILLLPRLDQMRLLAKVTYIVTLGISVSNNLVITAVNTMKPPEAGFLLPAIYKDFFFGRFPPRSFPAHWTSFPGSESFSNAAFNIGTAVFGLNGLWSLLPLAVISTLIIFASSAESVGHRRLG